MLSVPFIQYMLFSILSCTFMHREFQLLENTKFLRILRSTWNSLIHTTTLCSQSMSKCHYQLSAFQDPKVPWKQSFSTHYKSDIFLWFLWLWMHCEWRKKHDIKMKIVCRNVVVKQSQSLQDLLQYNFYANLFLFIRLILKLS